MRPEGGGTDVSVQKQSSGKSKRCAWTSLNLQFCIHKALPTPEDGNLNLGLRFRV
jgi:hypothetical protein